MITLTFADMVTGPGIAAVAALVTSLIAILKASIPGIDASVSGALMAFLFTGAAYLACAIALPTHTPDAFLLVFISWIAAASAAIGIHAGADHVATVRSKNRVKRA